MDKANQKIEGSKIGGAITQNADVASTNQSIKNTEAGGGANQRIVSQPSTLTFGKLKASGMVAVIGAVVILLAYVTVKYFTK
ncbi:MAG TPA: hypothetical protein VG097_07320 [Gemmata sp.]|jgi:hypothetical protein|nr:hypothetical protein [Gemmata sp.]